MSNTQNKLLTFDNRRSLPGLHRSHNPIFCEGPSGDGLVILPRSGVQRLRNPNLKTLSLHTDLARLYLLAAWRRGASPLAKQIAFETRKNIEALRGKPL